MELAKTSLYAKRESNELHTLPLFSDANLQGYWRLEDATDSSDNSYDLTNNNAATFVTGKFGDGVDLESGSSQYLSIADASCANLEISGSQTWGAWIKAESLGNNAFILGKHNNGSHGKDLRLFTDNKVDITFQGLSTTIQLKSDVVLEAGKWYFVCGIYDSANSKIKIWVNGTKKEAIASGSTTDANAPFFIGATNQDTGSTPGFFFDGIIDDAFVFDRALTDEEVQSIYGSGLQAYYRLEADGTDDSPNGYDLTEVNTPTYVAGKFGNGADLELSSSQYLSIAAGSEVNIDITGSQSWGCWIKPESLTQQGHIMGYCDVGLTNFKGFYFDSSDYTPRFALTGLTTTLNIKSSTGTISTGTWYFLCGVYDSANSKLKIFVNGTKTEATASGSAVLSAGEFCIGRWGAYTTLNFDGIIDDAFIFNRALTDAEVTKLYTTTSPAFLNNLISYKNN